MPSILVTCIPYLVNIPRSPVLFLREKEEELIWVRGTGRAVRGCCSQDKISERRILLKSKLPYIKTEILYLNDTMYLIYETIKANKMLNNRQGTKIINLKIKSVLLNMMAQTTCD